MRALRRDGLKGGVPDMPDVRLFIAANVPDGLKDRLGAFCSKLMGLDMKCRWVSAPNMHFTLRFLGSVPEEKIGQLVQALKNCAAKNQGFELTVDNFGVFGPQGSPRVFWAGTDQDGARGLLRVFGVLEAELALCGFEVQARPFVPHLTLCRIKGGPQARVLVDKARKHGFSPYRVRIETISLYKSVTKPDGPVYEEISRQALGCNV